MPALSDAGTFLVAERTTYAATILGLNSSCQLPIALKWQRFENFGIEFTKKVGCGQPHGTGGRQLQMSVDTGGPECTFSVYFVLLRVATSFF